MIACLYDPFCALAPELKLDPERVAKYVKIRVPILFAYARALRVALDYATIS